MRIIISGANDEAEKLEQTLEALKSEKVLQRWYHRVDGNYRAYHCTLREGNRCFPWEVQIWDLADQVTNAKEHRRHDLERLSILRGEGLK